MNAPGAPTGAFACDRPGSTALQKGPPPQVCRLRNSGHRQIAAYVRELQRFPSAVIEVLKQGPLALAASVEAIYKIVV